MQKERVIIIGAGPCGLSAAIELQKAGIEPLLIEKGNVVNSFINILHIRPSLVPVNA